MVYNCDGESDYLTAREKSVNYFHVREEVDRFPDSFIIDVVETDQKHDIHLGLADMLRKVNQKDLS